MWSYYMTTLHVMVFHFF